MSTSIETRSREASASIGTSGMGTLRGISGGVKVVLLGGSLFLGVSTGDIPYVVSDLGNELVIEATSSRTFVDYDDLARALVIPSRYSVANQAAIHELRHRSGLTWDQVADLMGVSRRSVHLWASGRELSARNQEHLHRVLAAVRAVDHGSAGATRSALFATDSAGTNVFDLLKARQHQDALFRLGKETHEPVAHGHRLAKVSPPMGSEPAPETLVGALHGRVHREGNKPRGVRAAKAKKKA